MAQYVRNSLDDFGARYLDPMLGMWISVDKARQFDSPYLYMGNGTNPAILTDSDGNIVPLAGIGLGVVGGVAFGLTMEYINSHREGRDFNYTKGDLATDAALGAVLGATGTGGIALAMAAGGAMLGKVALREVGKKLVVGTVARAAKAVVGEPLAKEASDTMKETFIGQEHLDILGDAFSSANVASITGPAAGDFPIMEKQECSDLE